MAQHSLLFQSNLAQNSRLSLIIVGGFLGSGKTTLLSSVLEQPKVHVLINDLGVTAPDLAFMQGNLHVLLGGCACCEKRSELVTKLRQLCSLHHQHPKAMERIVLELNGLADPANILHAIDNDPVLTANLRVDNSVTTIDAVRGIGDLIHEPLARKQLQQCEQVIVTKADLADEKQLHTTLATAARLNPSAKLAITALGIPQPLPRFSPLAAVDISALTASDHSEEVQSVWIPYDQTINWTAFALWFGSLTFAHQHDILRAKGLLQTAHGLVIVHAARGVIGVPTFSTQDTAPSSDMGLLLLVRNLSQAQLEKSWQQHVVNAS